MLKLRNGGNNYTVVGVTEGEFLFSYDTCVAGRSKNGNYFKSSTSYGTTTAKHINKYLSKNDYLILTTDEINNLLNEIKC